MLYIVVPTIQDLSHPTKRDIASRVYDLLGWFSPSVVQAKILLQRVWETGGGWD